MIIQTITVICDIFVTDKTVHKNLQKLLQTVKMLLFYMAFQS